ncbi:MAG: hypothetical protein RPT25_06720 [Cycloclasticus sp.]
MVLKKIRQIIEDSLPGIYSQTLAPREGVIVNVGRAKADATICDEFMPVYAVDVRLLNEAGESDEDMSILASLPLPLNHGGGESGFFGAPGEGMRVVISFIYGLPSKPYIQTILPTGAGMPGIKRGEMIWTQGAGISQSVDRAGNWKRETNKTILDSCDTLSTTAREHNETIGNRNTKVKGHWLIKCFGFFKVFAFGSISIVSGARVNLSAAETLNLTTAKDLNASAAENITLKCAKKINQEAAEEHHTTSPKVYIGSETVDLVAMVESLAEQLAALDDAVKGHTHGGVPENTPIAAPDSFSSVKSAVNAIKSKVAGIKVAEAS